MATLASKIPLTDLRSLYKIFDLFTSLGCHLALAQEVFRDNNPATLAGIFEKSVKRFSQYSNIDQPFYPDPSGRTELPNPEQIDDIGSTLSLTAFLKAAHSAEVIDNPSLNFNYVDREIVPARTTGKAMFDNGEPATQVRRLDWLLANSQDRLPIIAEVKVGDDKDPFYALVQLLMYAAELATASQLARLQRHYPNHFNLADSGPNSQTPVLDAYIVLSNYNPRSGVRQQILETTNQLCQRLIAEPGISTYIRRLACLDVTLGEGRKLRFTKLFSYSDV